VFPGLRAAYLTRDGEAGFYYVFIAERVLQIYLFFCAFLVYPSIADQQLASHCGSKNLQFRRLSTQHATRKNALRGFHQASVQHGQTRMLHCEIV